MAINALTLTSSIGTVTDSATAAPYVVLDYSGELLQLGANLALGSNGFSSATMTISVMNPDESALYQVLGEVSPVDGTVDAVSIIYDTTAFRTIMITLPSMPVNGRTKVKLAFAAAGDGDSAGTLAVYPRFISASRVA